METLLAIRPLVSIHCIVYSVYYAVHYGPLID